MTNHPDPKLREGATSFRLRRFRWSAGVAALAWALAGASSTLAKPSRCNQPAAKPIVKVGLPGRPFEALASADGCWIFASFMPSVLGAPGQGHFFRPGGIAVLRRDGGKVIVKRVVQLDPQGTAAAGIVLTHDGKTLIATSGPMVAFLDIQRMETGKGKPVLGFVRDGPHPGSIYDNVSAHDRFVFVSDEGMQQVSVIDFAEIRRSHFAQQARIRIGAIPVGNAPVGLAFSNDNRYLFVTSELWGEPIRLPSAARTAGPPAQSAGGTKQNSWPMTCHPEMQRVASNRQRIRWPEGAIPVVSMAQAEGGVANPVINSVPAGCSPVRDEVLPDGKTLYVTARGSNALLAFDTAKLVTDSSHALIATVPVGTAPVGLAVVDGGRKVVVAHSSRFGGRGGQDLTVVDVSGIRSGQAKIEGTIPAGSFPRELHTTLDGKTLLLTNFGSEQLELIDLARLRSVLKPPAVTRGP